MIYLSVFFVSYHENEWGPMMFGKSVFFKMYRRKKCIQIAQVKHTNKNFQNRWKKRARQDYTRFTLASDKTGLAKTLGSRCASCLTLIYYPDQGKTVLTSER